MNVSELLAAPVKFSKFVKVTPATVPEFAPVRFQVLFAVGPTSVLLPDPPMRFVKPLIPPVPVAVFAPRFTVTGVVYAE